MMSIPMVDEGTEDRRRKVAILLAVLLAVIAVGRIAWTYRVTSVAWDEPCHIAAGLEWVEKGTYTIDPIHPPLSRLAIGIPLYLAGERLPTFADGDARDHDYYEVGGKILYASGHYLRNLILARLAALPFFLVTIVLVFCWTRALFGTFAALMAVFFYTTTPSVLAFAGLAYTDTTTACTQFGALFALAYCIQKPTWGRTAILGVALGLALLSKMTTILFFPACAVGIMVGKWMVEARAQRDAVGNETTYVSPKRQLVLRIGASVAIALVVLWGGYHFSVGHVQEDMALSPAAMPSFQHFPGPIRSLARRAVASDWIVPAPALIRGFTLAWLVNKMRLPSYMFGTATNGGLWYFFFVALAVKMPLALLILGLVGTANWARVIRQRDWMQMAPVIAVGMVLLAAISVQYKEGVRHILVVFPLLAMVAAQGAAYLWQLPGKRNTLGKFALVSLILWQGAASLSAGRDFISYYNELAGRDPSRIYMTGCDLDCGQDVERLAEETRRLHISKLNLAMWSAADIDKMGLPEVHILEPYRPVTGWVAISVRSLRLGQEFHKAYAVDAFAWLDRYEPVQKVGKTVALYHIPESGETAVGAEHEIATPSAGRPE